MLNSLNSGIISVYERLMAVRRGFAEVTMPTPPALAAHTNEQRYPMATARLQRDHMRLKLEPLPYVWAEPLPHNTLLWHYVLKGPEDTAYAGGYYHGSLMFTGDYPFEPPTIRMITPNGRFTPKKRIPWSVSDGQGDAWSPTWWVGSILMDLLSFMLEDEPTGGSRYSSDNERKHFARVSLHYNLNDAIFVKLFPQLADEIQQRIAVPRKAANP